MILHQQNFSFREFQSLMTSRTIVSESFMLTNFHHVAWEAPPLPDISISKSVAPHTHKRPAHYLSNFRVDFEFVNCHITLHHLNHSREFAAVHLPVQVHVCGHIAPSRKIQLHRKEFKSSCRNNRYFHASDAVSDLMHN